MIETRAIDPPSEGCVDTAVAPWFTAPAPLVEPNSESRLISILRDAARTRDSRKILVSAAVRLYGVVAYRAAHPEEPLYEPFDYWLSMAMADLAITGRTAYASFQRAPLSDGSLAAAATAQLSDDGVTANPAYVAEAVATVLDRAYSVAWALRGPAPQRNALREELKWMAVSGEDDKPHRPVNARALSGAPPPYEQFEIDVNTPVPGPPAGMLSVRTRFFIASAADNPFPDAPLRSARTLPPDPVPHIPAGHQVILFVHGHSSAAEEALAITPHILKAGLDRGRQYSVVSFDLPNNGYSASFGQNEVANPSLTSWPSEPLDTRPVGAPILDYLENFVVAFVDALHDVTPIKERFAGVIGGSLGGNLGLRLGQRDIADCRWLQAGIVSWSPAGVWKPMVNSLTNSLAPGRCFDNAVAPENDSTSRKEYFSTVYDKPAIEIPTAGTRTQPEMWYRDEWQPCKSFQIQMSRLARQEIYDENFRQFHWRVACEQLIFSHDDHVDHVTTNPWRYELNNKVPLLLMAGEKDNFIGTYIYRGAGVLCRKMVNTPGRSVFLKNTGHSMHVERPHYVAGQIVDFLYTAHGLTFGDGQGTVIDLWNPTSAGAQGVVLLDDAPSRLNDLQVLNRFENSVQIVGVRITSPGDAPGAPVFTVLSQLPFNVLKGDSGWVAVRYNGAKVGTLTGFVEVECDDPGDPIARMPLAATVVRNQHAELEFTSSSLDLGTIPVGTAVAKDITITNRGPFDATLAITTIPDQSTGPFTVGVSYPALGLPTFLAASESVEIGVRFEPKDRGPANAAISIDMQSRTVNPTALFNRHHEIPLAGMAHMPTIFLAGGPQRRRHGFPIPESQLTMLDFGVAPPSQTAAASFWIRNIGDAPLTVTGVSSLHGLQDNFLAANSNVFPATLLPGSEKEVPCVYTGGSLRGMSHGSEFRVLSDDPRSPIEGTVLKVQGKVAGPHLSEPNEQLDFGVVSTWPASRTIVFRSDGTDPVRVDSIVLPSGLGFSVSSAPQVPARLAPGAELTLTVALTANQPGRYQAQLFVHHDGNPDPAHVSQVVLLGNV